MKLTLILLTFLISSSTVGFSDLVYAKTLIVDPNIPNGETITYTSRVAD